MRYSSISKDFWNSKAIIEEFSTYPLSKYWISFFDSIRNKPQKKVLDLGCGGGRNTEMFVNFGFDVYACDLYEGMVSATKKRLKNKICTEERIKKGEMQDLPYVSDFFDIVLSHGVYHNAQSKEEFQLALGESSRVLKSDGFLCFNIFTSDFVENNLKMLDKIQKLYTTKEGILMVLLSRKEFLDLSLVYNLKPYSKIVFYKSTVSTGKRSVLRGVLIKK